VTTLIILNNTCLCCGQTLAFVGLQEYPAKYNLPPRTIIHCTNIDCPMFEMTDTAAGLQARHDQCRATKPTPLSTNSDSPLPAQRSGEGSGVRADEL